MDQNISIPGLLVHRSAITHSALIVLAVSVLASRLGSDIRRLVTYGAAIGLALHLVTDMFPKAWTGYALVYVPVLGRLTWVPFDGNWFPGVFSFCWFGANAAAQFWIARRPPVRFWKRSTRA